MSKVFIRDIHTYVTAPNGINVVVVKILTTKRGLYGLGCATFVQRHEAVVTVIDKYLRPLLKGRCVDNIEDISQLILSDSYWRNGPILGNALSGIDEALWDIKGKMAGMPVYDLFGGKCRPAAEVYRHADGPTIETVEEKVSQFVQEGYHCVRCQLGTYGGSMFGAKQNINSPEELGDGHYYNPQQYMDNSLNLFEHLRKDFDKNLNLIHDIHERLTPIQAISFTKEMEKFKLFFLEDPLPPEQSDWFPQIRQHSSVPIAMGELINNPIEWRSIISNKWIDYIRIHISQIGGLTAARKVAFFSEQFCIKTAWHGPNDISPVGVTAQLHLDLASPNFGIQEFSGFSKAEKEIFPGCPVIKDGYLYANDLPGLGIDFNEELAKKYPPRPYDFSWLHARLPDGTCVRA